jgi:hypothetical protein
VTAESLDDAVAIAKRAGHDVPASFVAVHNVRAEDLDPRDVLPNAGELAVRGVWFPRTNAGAAP